MSDTVHGIKPDIQNVSRGGSTSDWRTDF